MYASYSIVTKVFYFFSNILYNVFIKSQYFFLKSLDIDMSNVSYYLSNEQIIYLEKSYEKSFQDEKTILSFFKSIIRYLFYIFIFLYSLFIIYKFSDYLYYSISNRVGTFSHVISLNDNLQGRLSYKQSWNFLINNKNQDDFKELCRKNNFRKHVYGVGEVLDCIKRLVEHKRQCDSYNFEVNIRRENLVIHSFIYFFLLYLFVIDIS